MTATPDPWGRPHTPPEWTRDAACLRADPDMWYPERGGSPKAAKAVCERCPVRVECLDWAVANGELFGVWGGLSAHERRRLRRHADRPDCERRTA